MRALLVILIVLFGAASAFAYGNADTAGWTSMVSHTSDMVQTEPATLLLSGALLLAVGGLVRRFSV